MLSHLFLVIRGFARPRSLSLQGAAGPCAAIVIGCVTSQAAAEPVIHVGTLNFAPAASALTAAQRQTLDGITQRSPAPWCVEVGLTRSGGPVTDLTALERARADYVTRLFALRGVTVVSTGVGWRRLGDAQAGASNGSVIWAEAPCPGIAPANADSTKPLS